MTNNTCWCGASEHGWLIHARGCEGCEHRITLDDPESARSVCFACGQDVSKSLEKMAPLHRAEPHP
jgi:PHP family Zn ribbon phosphoesterase